MPIPINDDGTFPWLRDERGEPYLDPSVEINLGPVLVQESDPGAVGAGSLWLTSTGLSVRNATNDGWLELIHAD